MVSILFSCVKEVDATVVRLFHALKRELLIIIHRISPDLLRAEELPLSTLFARVPYRFVDDRQNFRNQCQ